MLCNCFKIVWRNLKKNKVYSSLNIVGLWNMLSKDFVLLVIISCGIATPIAWYFLTQWLQKYEYRTDISRWVFAAAIGGSLVITLLTVSFQAIKAAIANPVKSPRTE